MTTINQDVLLNVIRFFEEAAQINQKTTYCVDVCLTGNWNEVEVRIYDSKDIPASNQLLLESVLLDGSRYDTTEKLEQIQTTLSDILKSAPNELLQSSL